MNGSGQKGFMSKKKRPTKAAGGDADRKNGERHVAHRDPNIAYHVEWSFRLEALRWIHGRPVGANLYPYAEALRAFMRQERESDFGFFTEADKESPGTYTNPYTYHVSTLTAIASEVINESYAIATSTEPILGVRAEALRVKSYNDQALYYLRVCEALTKQLLYCTALPEKNYMRAALGQLLSRDCLGCKASKMKKHKLSLLGSLAHRYRQCGQFEQCLKVHLKLAARRRNQEAAHSGAPPVYDRSAKESREHLMKDSYEIGTEFVHVLDHLSEIESRMISELEAVVQAWPDSLEALNSTSPFLVTV